MAEVAPAGGGPNKLFIALALGLVGLLIIGIVALGGILAIQQMTKPAVVPTATRVSIAITTPTRPLLPTPTTVPTETPLPSPTLVIQLPGGVVAPASGGAITPTVTLTATVAAGTGTPPSGMPDTGIGENLLLLAGGVVLVFVIFAARRARAPAGG